MLQFHTWFLDEIHLNSPQIEVRLLTSVTNFDGVGVSSQESHRG